MKKTALAALLLLTSIQAQALNEWMFYTFLDTYRDGLGLPLLERYETLELMARGISRIMATHRTVSHDLVDTTYLHNIYVRYLMQTGEPHFWGEGDFLYENLHMEPQNDTMFVSSFFAWAESPPHNQLLLNENAYAMGVAIYAPPRSWDRFFYATVIILVRE